MNKIALGLVLMLIGCATTKVEETLPVEVSRKDNGIHVIKLVATYKNILGAAPQLNQVINQSCSQEQARYYTVNKTFNILNETSTPQKATKLANFQNYNNCGYLVYDQKNETKQSVCQEFICYHVPKRLALGVQFQSVAPRVAKAYGITDGKAALVIIGILYDQPKLKLGDVVLKVAGQRVADTDDLYLLFKAMDFNTEVVKIQVLRNNQYLKEFYLPLKDVNNEVIETRSK